MMTKLAVLTILVLAFWANLAQSDEDPDDGNDRCTTDEKDPGYNHIYFPHWDKYDNRPKCDPEKHFGLKMTKENSNKDCFEFERGFFAFQIIPIGFTPNFNTDYKIKGLKCKDKHGDDAEQAIAQSKLEDHKPGKVCASAVANGAKKYQVFVLAKPHNEDPSAGQILRYQSARFLCEAKTNGEPNCKLNNPDDLNLCDTSF